MNPSRVLKKSTIPSHPARDSTHTIHVPLRVPGKRVYVYTDAEDADAALGESVVPVSPVLKAANVAGADPVELATLEFTPDFPFVPDSSDQADPARLHAAAADVDPEVRWQEKLESEVRVARREGFDSGYAEARKTFEQEYRERADLLRRDVERVAMENKSFLEQSEVLLVDLAFSIAQAVLDSPLMATARQAAGDAIAAAVERVAGQHPVRIRLHPVEYLRFQESGLVDQLSSIHAELRWEPDAGVALGDWTVESPEAMVRRLEHEIVEDLRERLGLLAAEHHRPHLRES